LLRGGAHKEAMDRLFGPDFAISAMTGVWVPDHINAMWMRCAACGQMADYEQGQGKCRCGQQLPEPPAVVVAADTATRLATGSGVTRKPLTTQLNGNGPWRTLWGPHCRPRPGRLFYGFLPVQLVSTNPSNGPFHQSQPNRLLRQGQSSQTECACWTFRPSSTETPGR